MAGNKNLSAAKAAKKDEFYTQLPDIANELKHYKKHFKGKVVLCNCDDPYESNFFKFFALKFNEWGLKKLICTCYNGSPIAGRELQLDLFSEVDGDAAGMPHLPERKAFKLELTEVWDINGDGAKDLLDVQEILRQNPPTVLKGNGDFRSEECIELLKEADIVVTNPPFSLFREYVAQLVEYGKKFLIIGPVNAVSTKEIFHLIMQNEIWFGYGFNRGNAYFSIPCYTPDYALGVYDEETGLVKFRNCQWFTNLDHDKRHTPLDLYKSYSPEEYPHYDNCDAIDVSKTSEIPVDYDEAMGVPLTFLDKYCPDQFEIIGISKTWFGFANKIYPKQLQIDKNGKQSTVTKLNDGAVIRLDKPPVNSTYYMVADEIFVQTYPRILIRKRK